MNQRHTHTHTHIHTHTRAPSLLSFPPTPHPNPPVITEPGAEFSVLYSSILLAISFARGGVRMLVLISQLAPPSHVPSVSTCPFSVSVPLFLPCRQAYQYHFPRFHMYAIIYNIWFSLPDWLHSVWVSNSIPTSANDPILCTFVAEKYSTVCMYHIFRIRLRRGPLGRVSHTAGFKPVFLPRRQAIGEAFSVTLCFVCTEDTAHDLSHVSRGSYASVYSGLSPVTHWSELLSFLLLPHLWASPLSVRTALVGALLWVHGCAMVKLGVALSKLTHSLCVRAPWEKRSVHS